MKSHSIVLIKIILSTTLLAFLLNRINFRDVFYILDRVNWLTYCIALCLAITSWYISAEKWRVLLPKKIHYTKSLTFKITLISMAYSYLLPGGQITGEIGKMLHSSFLINTERAKLISSIIIDKLFGLSALVTFGLIGFLFAPQEIRSFIFLYILAATVLTISCFLLFHLIGKTQLPILESSPNFLETLSKKYLSSNFLDKKRAAQSLALSMLNQWLIICIQFSLALSIGLYIPIHHLLWIVATVSFLSSLPISYAGFGIRELSLTYLLSLLLIAGPQAISLSLLVYSIQFVGSLVGIFLILSSSKRIST